MNETTLWNVAESQQTIQQPAVEQTAQTVEAQPTQTVEQDNVTWTSSWVEQTTQSNNTVVEQPATPEVDTQDIIASLNKIAAESKTLDEVAQESEQDKQKSENDANLQSIINDTVKDLPEKVVDVNTQQPEPNNVESDKDAKELESMFDDIKDKKHAEEVAKKAFLAFQKERNLRELDNQQNKEMIAHLKKIISEQKRDAVDKENDPRVVKLDDEAYTQWSLEQAYKKDKSTANKKNLNRFYIAKLAVNNPEISANKFLELMDNASIKHNNIWEAKPTSAPVVEVRQPTQIPRWIPSSKRGII